MIISTSLFCVVGAAVLFTPHSLGLSTSQLMEREGCGDTKGCLFKPAGCDPRLDCSIAVIFYVSGVNKLQVQMSAQGLIPSPELQYIAIAFSTDLRMGNDFVSECVLSPDGSALGEAEVFASYNLNRTANERTNLDSAQRPLLYDNVEGEVVDGRLYCSFEQTIRPQFAVAGKLDRIWNLDQKYWLMAATGSAQPDEINAHDTSMGSHLYPIVSSRAINPSKIGHFYPLPAPFDKSALAPKEPVPNAVQRNPVVQNAGCRATMPVSVLLSICLIMNAILLFRAG